LDLFGKSEKDFETKFNICYLIMIMQKNIFISMFLQDACPQNV